MKKKSKSNGLIRIVVVVLGLAAVIGIFVVRPQLKLKQARHDVDELVVALNGFYQEHHAYPDGTLAEIAELLLGKDVRGQNPHKLDYVEAASCVLNAAGELVDPWGTPYHISTKDRVQIYSCGPDRVDANGEGDDIASWK